MAGAGQAWPVRANKHFESCSQLSSLLCHSALYNVVLGRSCRRSQGSNIHRDICLNVCVCVCVIVCLPAVYLGNEIDQDL